MAETLSKFFVKAVDKLDVRKFKKISNIDGLSDPVEIAIKKYENHPSIVAIIEKFNFTVRFAFEEVNLLLRQIASRLKYLKKRLTSAALCFSR